MLKNTINIFRLNYKYIYSGMLMIIVAVLPHSRYLLSMSEIGLVFFWILEGNFKMKVKSLKIQPEILVFASIFIIHLIGLIYTQNFSYAFKDIKIKLPLLIFPIVLGTSLKLSSKEIKQILIVFTISILIKTFYGTALLSGLFGTTILNPQHLAGKYSHIRYALMLNIVAFTMVYFLIFSKKKEKLRFKILYLITFIWISVFLLILHSVTGWVIYLILFIFSVLRFALSQNNRFIKAVFFLLTLFIVSGVSFYIVNSVRKFYKSDIIAPNAIEHYTKDGNPYNNNFNSTQKENGHFVNLYLCEKELQEAWNKVSKIKYNEIDKENQPVKYTLIRYLTSKNLRKDKVGVKQLSKQDIENIENGMTNYIFADKFSLYPKIYEILWQMNRYYSGGNPDNQSISQRFEFLKAGKEIIKRNFWFGTGTGDVADEFKKQYELSKSRLSEKHRLRAHNQYVTIFITFGVFGFFWFLFALIYPVIKTKKYRSYLFSVSFIIIVLSMLNEDTLETQMGATVFAFFLSFFLFAGEKTATD